MTILSIWNNEVWQTSDDRIIDGRANSFQN